MTQADVDNGSVTNSAEATRSRPAIGPGDLAPVLCDRGGLAGHLEADLTKSTTSTGYGAAGNTIPYSYLVDEHRDDDRVQHRGDRQQDRHGQLPGLRSLAPGRRRPARAPTR